MFYKLMHTTQKFFKWIFIFLGYVLFHGYVVFQKYVISCVKVKLCLTLKESSGLTDHIKNGYEFLLWEVFSSF